MHFEEITIDPEPFTCLRAPGGFLHKSPHGSVSQLPRQCVFNCAVVQTTHTHTQSRPPQKLSASTVVRKSTDKDLRLREVIGKGQGVHTHRHTHMHGKQLCTTLLLHAEVISLHSGLTPKVRRLWCYFKMQVIKYELKDTCTRLSSAAGEKKILPTDLLDT